uniref:Citrate transporter-like domain-containing protein n=1 Tax=Zooxanthella nutricula TaxID=1333877 RepID=A0A7S2Q8M9_9DINO
MESNTCVEGELQRSASNLERAGTLIRRAGSNIVLQRASTLPTETRQLQHAATMPMMFDQDSDRPCCGGLWKMQQLIGFLLGVGLQIGLSWARPLTEFPAANDMMGIASLCACFWVFEVIPVYMTAIFPIVLMPFLEVTSSEIAAQAYWNWISLMVVGVFLVDIALEEVHLPRRVSLLLLLRFGIVHPAALLACFMGLCWFLSMFANSVAVTLLITPFAISLMNAAEEHAWNQSEAISEGDDESADEVSAEDSKVQASEVQRFSDCLLLGIAYSSTSGGIATITGTINHYFLAGEALVASKITWGLWFLFGIPISIFTVIMAYVSLYFGYVRKLKFKGLEHDVLEQEYQQLLQEVGPFSRDELLVAAIQVLQVVLLAIRPWLISPVFTNKFGEKMVNDATIACLPALLLFFIPSVVRPGQAVLTWPAVHEKFDFGLLLLIGGALAINSGFIQSGLNLSLGQVFADILPHAGCVQVDFVIIVLITLCCQLFSSIGTAASMFPVLSAAAMQAVVNPMSLLLPAAVATSFAFLLPTASPPNVVVLAKSQELPRPLRIRDFFVSGLPLTILAILGGTLLTHVMGMWVFDSKSPFPKWACEAASGSCMWVDVPGDVQGRTVAQQACIVDMSPEANGKVCSLWNMTTLTTADFM